MRYRIATIISSILHPILLPIPTFWAMLYALPLADDQVEKRGLYLALAVLVCSVTPVVVVLALKKRGKVNDLDISQRHLRFIPFVIGIAFYFIGYGLLEYLGAPPLVRYVMLCYALNTFAIMLITLVWKISVHTTSFGGPAAALYVAFGGAMLWLLLLMPVLIWSRVELKAHTAAQAATGALIGYAFTLLELRYFLG